MRKLIYIALALALAACQPAQRLVILHVNDTHSHFEPVRSGEEAGLGGVIERAAYIDSVRAAEGAENVLLLHAGDFSQGTSYFTVLGGDLEIATINAMGYDAITLGNHEFDNGIEELARRMSMVKCPVVCASYDFSSPDVFGFGSNSGKQIIWIATSIVLGAMLLFIEKRVYDMSAYFMYTVMILLLIATIFIAPDTKGSRSWIPIGSAVKLQPAEFAKFAVALAIAKVMDTYGFSMNRTKDFVKVVAMIVFPMLLIIMQKETGSALVYLSFFLVLYREGMTGSLLFTAFACVLYFVVGIRYNDAYMDSMPVSIGEFSVLLIAQIFTTAMTWLFCRDRFALRFMLYVGGGVSLLAFLFSSFVIPFDVSK
ncbi:MAG: FtsW/RodA/SpoVE family cell cycle protein, partial [Bacteroidales bacterium]|nr:FtsW/RodA/SpoVE family cell cycle protein [Bacteroidales bacterium]